MTNLRGAVCLDVQGAQNQQHFDRGIPRYICEHARALTQSHSSLVDAILLNPTLPVTGNLDWAVGTGRLQWTSSDLRASHLPRTRPSIYHVMSPFELGRALDELWPVWARGADVRTVVTLYDLIPLVFDEHYLRDPVFRARYEARANIVRNSDQVLAISQFTAEDAIRRLGVDERRVTVIDAGATDTFARMYPSRERAEEVLSLHLPSVRSGFLLYVGGFEFRKNIERLIEGYAGLPARLRADHQLVIACSLLPSETRLLRELARAEGLRPSDLVLTGYVIDEVLGALYHACSLFVFPSFYEGSGLPILEAMSCGAPVAASLASTTPEIFGDDEATFDPFEPASIAACLQRVLEDEVMLARLTDRSRRRVVGYTWDHVAEQSVIGYERALPSNARKRRRRDRVALVTPWPPEQSGIADYNRRLVAELGRHVDVDVVVASPTTEYSRPLEPNTQLFHGRHHTWERLRVPDRVIYCMGNSSYHAHVYELLRQRPGTVVAHDVRFTGFYGWYAGRERADDPAGRLRERMVAQYGHRLAPSFYDAGPPDPSRQAALGVYMTREIQEYAEQLLVHSRYAADVLRLDRPPLERAARVSVVPFGLPDPETIVRDGSDIERPLIVSVGVLHEVKGLHALIEAFSLVVADRPESRLVIAGPGIPEVLRYWRELARELTPAGSVDIPGHLPTEQYARLLGQAMIGVQLRTVSNGEASASIGDCLAAGLPTVVTDHGWAAELPAGTVLRTETGADATTIAAAIESLMTDAPLRADLRKGALAHARGHSFDTVAMAYLQAIGLR